MIEQPSLGRASIRTSGNSLVIEIPAKKNWFVIIFLGAWLIGWFMGESSALKEITDADTPIFANAFLLVWLIGWTIGGFFAVSIFLWMLIGQEKIIIERKTIEFGKYLLSLKRTKKYNINSIANFDINPQPHSDIFGMNQRQNFFGFKGGVLKFDYGMKTIRFAGGIDEAEGRMILDELRKNSNFEEKNFA